MEGIKRDLEDGVLIYFVFIEISILSQLSTLRHGNSYGANLLAEGSE